MSFSIEMLRQSPGGFRCALFDFDGTVSLIRAGWQEVMIPYFCEVLRSLHTNESDEALRNEVADFVNRLTGKQTIFQCMALADAIASRGFEPEAPGAYKAEYLRRLAIKTAAKKEGLKTGTIHPDALAVKGARLFIKKLRDAGISCYLASGTDEEDVKYEATLLDVADLFNGGIFGAKDDLTDCSKEAVIRRLISQEGISPQELIGFGDGFVEISLIAEQGGYAVGAATDELHGDGIDSEKRERLLNAGADVIIPHFEQTERILAELRI